jgi:hypothetical protein
MDDEVRKKIEVIGLFTKRTKTNHSIIQIAILSDIEDVQNLDVYIRRPSSKD